MNKIIIAVIALLVGAGGGFYGGTLYQKKQTSNNTSQRQGFVAGQGFGNMTAEQRASFMQNAGQNRGTGTNSNLARGAGGMENLDGQIITKDDRSITLKTNSGSVIVYVTSSTARVMKSTSLSVKDLTNGQTVQVSAVKDDSGAYNARMIRVDEATTSTIK